MSKQEAGKRGGHASGAARKLKRQQGNALDLPSSSSNMFKQQKAMGGSSGIDDDDTSDQDSGTATTQSTKRKRRSTLLGPNSTNMSNDSASPSGPMSKIMAKSLDTPQHLPTIQVLLDTEIEIPITIKIGQGKVFRLSADYNPTAVQASFWKNVGQMVEKLAEVCPDEIYETTKVDLERGAAGLGLYQTLFPTLVHQYGNLRHRALTEKPLAVAQQRTFLNHIINNATSFLQSIDKSKQPGILVRANPVSTIVSQLLAISPSPMISLMDHTEQLQQHTATFVHLAENIRRELTTYGVTISKLANQAIEDRVKTQAIAAHLYHLLGHEPLHPPLSTFKTRFASDAHMPNQDDPLEIKTEAGDGDGSMENTDDVLPELPRYISTLPDLYLEALDGEAHRCRCLICEPDAYDNLVQEAAEALRGQQAYEIQEDVKKQMVEKFQKEFLAEARQEARANANKEAATIEGQAILAEFTDQLRGQLWKEIEAEQIPVLREQVKEELMAKMAN